MLKRPMSAAYPMKICKSMASILMKGSWPVPKSVFYQTHPQRSPKGGPDICDHDQAYDVVSLCNLLYHLPRAKQMDVLKSVFDMKAAVIVMDPHSVFDNVCVSDGGIPASEIMNMFRAQNYDILENERTTSECVVFYKPAILAPEDIL